MSETFGIVGTSGTSEIVKPAGTAKLVEMVKPLETADPAGVAEFPEMAKLVGGVKPPEVAERIGMVKPLGVTEPVVNPPEATELVGVIEPSEIVRAGADLFHKAQKLQTERIPSQNDEKKHTVFRKGAMMSSGAFCGYCGSRLSIVTSRDTRVNACDEKTYRERLRYKCYGKTRSQTPCSGQSSSALKLDKMVEGVICQILDRSSLFIEDTPESFIQLAIGEFREQIDVEKLNCSKFSTDYNDAIAELSFATQYRNKLIIDKLQEFSDHASGALHECEGKISALRSRLKQAELQLDRVRNLTSKSKMQKWSALFSNADMSVKRHVFGLLIKKVTVYSRYRMHIELNIDASQSNLGLDIAPSTGFIPSDVAEESAQVSFANKSNLVTVKNIKHLLCNVAVD